MSLDFFFARDAVLSDRCHPWRKVTSDRRKRATRCALVNTGISPTFQRLKHGTLPKMSRDSGVFSNWSSLRLAKN
jgi:hypothetical protein